MSKHLNGSTIICTSKPMDLNRIIAVQNPSIQGTNVHVQAPQTEINLQFVNPSTSSEALQFNVYKFKAQCRCASTSTEAHFAVHKSKHPNCSISAENL